MISKRTKRQVDAFRMDNRSGSADLNLRAVDIFLDYMRTAKVREKGEFLEDLREICGGLMIGQSTMSLIRNTCVEVLHTLLEFRNGASLEKIRLELERKLSRLSMHVINARPNIASHLGKVLPKDARLLTVSYSSTVAQVLKELKRRGKSFQVTVMESRPMFEGRRTAAELLRAKIRTSIIADAAVGEFSKMSDLAVVGADTVFSDGATINKIGTLPLALCCREARIPFYVLADSSKISSESSSAFTLVEKKPSELLKARPSGLSVKNIYFDVTPPKYIIAIITERGIFSPRMIKEKST